MENIQLNFPFKNESLIEFDQYDNIDNNIFFANPTVKNEIGPENEIYITDIQNDPEEVINHEITDTENLIPDFEIEYNTECNCGSMNTTAKTLCWLKGRLTLGEEDTLKEEKTIATKTFIFFPNYSAVSVTSNLSNVIYWMEGNISEINSYCAIPKEIVYKYYENNIPHRNMLMEQQELLADKSLKVFLSWDAVTHRIDDLGEESHTKYIVNYRQSTFHKEFEPRPFANLVFEMRPFDKKVDISIPFNGIPFHYIGRCTMTCHLGKPNYKLKTINTFNKNGEKVYGSKKIGCPAKIDIVKIVRFPDFDISQLKLEARVDVIRELNEALTIDNDAVRYYIEYHFKEPCISAHCGHEKLSGSKEPPHPKFQSKVNELVKKGIDLEVINKEYLKKSLHSEVGSLEDDRRRFNPTVRDVRYMKKKAQHIVEQDRSNDIVTDCEQLMSDIMQMSDDNRRIEMRDQLQQIRNQIQGSNANILEQTSNITLQDGINMLLENVAQDVEVNGNDIFTSGPIMDDSVYIDSPTEWNPINFVNCDFSTESEVLASEITFDNHEKVS